MSDNYIAPWFTFPAQTNATKRLSAMVIGGGIAGASTAYSLAKRGISVTLIERHEKLAQEGSGNDQGILYAQLSPHQDPQTQLILAGYRYTLDLLHHLPQGELWQQCGALHLPYSDKEKQRHLALSQSSLNSSGLFSLLNKQQAEQLAGIPLSDGGLFFHHSGWVSPAAIVKWLAEHTLINRLLSTEITTLQPQNNEWQAYDQYGNLVCQATIVVLANAFETIQLSQTAHLPLVPVRGQTSRLPATSVSKKLNIVLSGQSYLCPQKTGFHTFGATSIIGNQDSHLLPEEHQYNLQQLQRLSPQIAQSFTEQLPDTDFKGHSAIRCTSPDRLPLVGAIANADLFKQHYAHLTLDSKRQFATACPWQQGLYVNTAHGARGLITAPLSAEILACQITGQTPDIATEMINALNPNRFLVRQLIRGEKKVDEAKHHHVE